MLANVFKIKGVLTNILISVTGGTKFMCFYTLMELADFINPKCYCIKNLKILFLVYE